MKRILASFFLATLRVRVLEMGVGAISDSVASSTRRPNLFHSTQPPLSHSRQKVHTTSAYLSSRVVGPQGFAEVQDSLSRLAVAPLPVLFEGRQEVVQCHVIVALSRLRHSWGSKIDNEIKNPKITLNMRVENKTNSCFCT